MSTQNENITYDEFSMFHENAQEYGLQYEHPPVVRRISIDLSDGRMLSSLVWGTGSPRLVLLHGGAQNAHTWDTVALALDCPLVAFDLPGHGHSDIGKNGSLDTRTNAEDIAAVTRELAPEAECVVGMSLGGLTTLALASKFPELVRSIVLVDVTPGVTAQKSAAISRFIDGPEQFNSFDELLARTIKHNPTRTVSALRRGILHNAVQQADGSWVWRYARWGTLDTSDHGFGTFWTEVSELTVPLMLVRGMLPQSVVDDEDETELLRRIPAARVEHLADAGHNVQGETPVELADLIMDFLLSLPAGSSG